jgi:hypothetical protein
LSRTPSRIVDIAVQVVLRLYILFSGGTGACLYQHSVARCRTPPRSFTSLCIPCDLIFSLLVAVHNQLVEEATRLAVGVAFGFGTFGLLL